MKTGILGSVVVVLVLVLSAPGRAEPRPQVDSALLGRWNLQAISFDEGKTVEPRNGKTFARMTATEMRFPDGQRFQVNAVEVIQDDEGNPIRMILLSNGQVLTVSRKPGKPNVLVIAYKKVNGKIVEDCRFLVTIEQ